MPNIVHTFDLAAPPGAVYRALTFEDGLRSWWTKAATVEARLGAVNEFRFRGGAFNRMQVTALVEGESVRWTCVDGAEEWIGTEVSFELKSSGEGTVVHFSHHRWPADADEYRGYCSFAWASYFRGLQSLFREGRGTPNPGPDGPDAAVHRPCSRRLNVRTKSFSPLRIERSRVKGPINYQVAELGPK